MRKIFKRIFVAAISFALTLWTVVAGVFPATICVSAKERISYEQTDVLEDLQGAVINGKEFSLSNYKFNAYKETQVISFVEYCYSYNEETQVNYGLYVYVYNPQGIAFIHSSPLNMIEMAYGGDGNQGYSKYP